MPEDDAKNQAPVDPRKRDYAIVIGVTNYPSLSRDGASVDLQGPINDAEKVRAWLISGAGGGVPPNNIEYVVRATAIPTTTPDPTRDLVIEAFGRMYKRCWDTNDKPIIPTGRRLYVYVSGHGLAIDLDHGALLCSNSSPNLLSTVAPYISIKAFRQAGFFEEFVVWFDGCMDWAGLESEAINYNPRPGNSPNPPGPVFTAYAARPRLKAMECPDPNGVVRGVFTQTLLAGLEGGAEADPQSGGLIDCFSLQQYLINAMSKLLPASAKDDPLVDKQPFVRTDPNIYFGAPKPVAVSKIVLRFRVVPVPEGTTARVWGRKQNGPALSIIRNQPVRNGVVELELPNGIYAVDVPEHELQTGFEVTGGLVTKLAPGSLGDLEMMVEQPEIEVFEHGEALAESLLNSFKLHIETHDPTAQIVVLDDRFETKATAAGSLATTLPAGIYKIRIQRGASSLGFEDRVVVLDRDRNLSIDPPKLFSPAPFGGTQASRAHVAAREWLDAVVHVKLAKGAKIALLARYSPRKDREPLLHPFHGVRLHGIDEQLLVDLEQAAPKPHVPDTNDPISICGIAVAPGAYILRHQLANGRMLSQSVIASEGWQITINIRRDKQDITDDGKEFAGAGYVAVLMRRLMDEQAAQPAAMIRSSNGYISEDQLVDVARQGLADGNELLAGDLYDLLLRNVENPLAGIFGGLLLDIERQATGEKFDRERAKLFDAVVQRLRTMVGRAHPDVEALSFRCEDKSLTHMGPIEVRPMFHRCWRILLEAAASRPDLVPIGLWKSTSASGSMPPYFIWSISKEAQDARLQHFKLAAAQFSTKTRVEGAEIGAQAASIDPKLKTSMPSQHEIASELGLPVNALAELLDSP